MNSVKTLNCRLWELRASEFTCEDGDDVDRSFPCRDDRNNRKNSGKGKKSVPRERLVMDETAR